MTKTEQLPTNPNTETVTLETPLVRGEQSISTLTLTKPKSGNLRGVSLADLLKLDVDTIIKVVPRISSPSLTEHEVAELDPADLVKVSTAVVGFFVPASEKPVT